MAALATRLAMSHDHLPQQHPFFNVTQPTLPEPEHGPTELSHETDGHNDSTGRDSQKPRRVYKKRTAPTDAQRGLMAKFTGRTGGSDPNPIDTPKPSTLEDGAGSFEIDVNAARRKRRKTASPPIEDEGNKITTTMPGPMPGAHVSWRDQLEREAPPGKPAAMLKVEIASPAHHDTVAYSPSLAVDVAASTTPIPAATPPQEDLRTASVSNTIPSNPDLDNTGAPRKMLRLNATGKLGSPTTKPATTNAIDSSVDSRRKQRKGKQQRMKQIIVSIAYGRDEGSRQALGSQIDGIMAGLARHQIDPIEHTTTSTKHTAQPAGPPRPKHPLFMSKLEKQALLRSEAMEAEPPKPPQLPRRKAATSTPGKLRTRIRHHSPDLDDGSSAKPLFGDLRAVGLQKHPGSADAAWPWSGITHVRDLSVPDPRLTPFTNDRRPISGLPKGKHQCATVDKGEDIMHRLAGNLRVRDYGVDESPRLPKRIITNGESIQEAVRGQISSVPQGSKGERWLQKHYAALRTTLTPFDLGSCEQQSWVHKYAPETADEVLQSGSEVLALRQWLRCLTVTATESAVKPAVKESEKRKKRKKRKRRGSDLDDFIVDDDTATLDELTEPEDDVTLAGGLPSMVRSTKVTSGAKLSNVVLLSGPHGCGKTAAVYAVAKELGFEVFEINPGIRRAGKDVMDRVGDMTENHLVRQQVARNLELDHPHDDEEMEAQVDGSADLTKDEVASGRQTTMASFFQSTKTTTPRTATQKETIAAKKPVKHAPREGKSNQKQSLILLEEVDVLFDEDQGFWATVRALVTHSKRPIIMTCNDERLVNIEEDALHAVLRFRPTPTELATDYLLVIAACEGHLLQREAVRALYECRDRDLRASIADLNFWCQMALGDSKGGLEWMYQRWPPGRDVDEQGRTVRVASRATYLRGIGWFSQESVRTAPSQTLRSEALLREAWDNWNIAPDDWSSCEPVIGPADAKLHPEPGLQALHAAQQRAEMLSAVDSFARLHQSTPDLDASVPVLPARLKENFVEGYKLLEVEPLPSFDTLRVESVCELILSTRYADSNVSLGPAATFPPAQGEEVIYDKVLDTAANRHDSAVAASTEIRAALEPLTASHTSSLAFGAPNNVVPTLTSLNRPISILTVDIAPYVRSIAAYDMRLEAQRLRLSSLLSEAGSSERRMRKTRAARSALEGGRRETTRRERWFRGAAELNLQLVMETGGRHFAGIRPRTDEVNGDASETGSLLAGDSSNYEVVEGLKSSQASL